MAEKLSYEELLRKTLYAPLPSSRWRHYKTGNLYEVLGVCILEATQEPCILYRCVEPPGPVILFCRPVMEWHEIVNHEGKKVPRFVAD